MEIVFVSNIEFPTKSAESIFIMNMCQAFSNNGHVVKYLSISRDETEIQDPFEYFDVDDCFTIEEKKPYSSGFFGKLLAIILNVKKANEEDPDLVYTRSILAGYLATKYSLPTIVELHNPIEVKEYSYIRTKLFSKLINDTNLRGVVVISNELERIFDRKYDIPTGRIVVARDGATPQNRSERSSDISSDHSFDVGYIGQLYQGRGIELIHEVSQNCQWAEFHVIGGPEEEVARWRQRCSEQSNINFYGFVPPKELSKYRSAMDALLAPYQHDLETRGGKNSVDWMSPMKLFEYMASEKPILASDLAAIREFLQHNNTALLCDPENPDEWMSSLERVRNNPEIAKKISKNAKKEFLSNYTWEKRTEKILDELSAHNNS